MWPGWIFMFGAVALYGIAVFGSLVALELTPVRAFVGGALMSVIALLGLGSAVVGTAVACAIGSEAGDRSGGVCDDFGAAGPSFTLLCCTVLPAAWLTVSACRWAQRDIAVAALLLAAALAAGVLVPFGYVHWLWS